MSTSENGGIARRLLDPRGQVSVADLAGEKLDRAVTNDSAQGVSRHVDAGSDDDLADERGIAISVGLSRLRLRWRHESVVDRG